MPLPKKPLKISPREPKPWSQSCKDMLGKWTQSNTLSQLEKSVRINKIAANIDNLEINSLEVI